MKISVREAFASYSYRKKYDLNFSASELGELPAAVAAECVSAKATVSSEDGTVMCEMQIQTELETLCSRCAKKITVPFNETVRKIVRKDDDGAYEDVIYADSGLSIDITEEIRTQIYFGFPAIPLCREDCKGLCPVCGCDLNVTSCTCDIRTVDPRLAVLKNLTDKQ